MVGGGNHDKIKPHTHWGGDPALGSVGSAIGLMLTFKRVYAKGDLLGLLLPVPIPVLSHCQPTLVQETLQC